VLGYGLNHCDDLVRYLDDGRIEIDSNTVERSIPLALTRKNALFAGHDLGAEAWAMTASLIEKCKLNRVDPLSWMTDVLEKLVNRWLASNIDDAKGATMKPIPSDRTAHRWSGPPRRRQFLILARNRIAPPSVATKATLIA
jgi:Transposase IS66 family/IS66 C-terminal element